MRNKSSVCKGFNGDTAVSIKCKSGSDFPASTVKILRRSPIELKSYLTNAYHSGLVSWGLECVESMNLPLPWLAPATFHLSRWPHSWLLDEAGGRRREGIFPVGCPLWVAPEHLIPSGGARMRRIGRRKGERRASQGRERGVSDH